MDSRCKRNRQRTALSLALFLFLTVLLPVGFMVLEVGHTCAGLGCDVCDSLRALSALFRQFALPGALLLSASCYGAQSKGGANIRRSLLTALTPVSLRVRMDD